MLKVCKILLIFLRGFFFFWVGSQVVFLSLRQFCFLVSYIFAVFNRMKNVMKFLIFYITLTKKQNIFHVIPSSIQAQCFLICIEQDVRPWQEIKQRCFYHCWTKVSNSWVFRIILHWTHHIAIFIKISN